MEINFDIAASFIAGFGFCACLVYFAWPKGPKPPKDGETLYVLTLRQINMIIGMAQRMVRESSRGAIYA